MNTAGFVDNKEQPWNRACHSGMRSKQQSDFPKNPTAVASSSCLHLPLAQGCCCDHQTDPNRPIWWFQTATETAKELLGIICCSSLPPCETWHAPGHQHFPE